MKWVAFIGEGRSGHTIVASILDAHPNVRMSNEKKFISNWSRGNFKSKEEIFDIIIAGKPGKGINSKGGRVEWTNIEGQNCYTKPLLALGDKCGWEVVNLIKKGASSNVIDGFSSFIEMPVKIIHTSRNPLDNITAWYQSPKYVRLWGEDDTERLNRAIRRYARFYSDAQPIFDKYEGSVFHLRNEELCKDTKSVVRDLCGFLDLEVNDRHLELCRAAVNPEPNRRSSNLEWSDYYKDMMRWRIIDRFPSLGYYK